MELWRRFLTVAAASALPVLAKNDGEPYTPNYRISPIDGSKIALPTKEQLEFQDREIGLLIHFNIATYIEADGCNWDPSLVPMKTLFTPVEIDTDQWMQTAVDLGAHYATLVVKHNCGFTTWPSKVMFPDRDDEQVSYNYTVAQSPLQGRDIVAEFVASSKAKKIGHGFYYSSVVNNFLNVQGGKVRTEPLSEGQVGITDKTYDQVVFDQLTELWTEYGSLTEIWFDGGYTGTQRSNIQELLKRHQPQAVIFNGCQEDGTCVSENSVRWIGNEEGHAPEENWSTGLTSNGGSSKSPYFCPAECDTTLQWPKRWFWGADSPIRSLREMVDVYHKTVGHNCMLELDLSPGRDGLVPNAHVNRYRELGDFIKSCYGEPLRPIKTIDKCDAGVYGMLFEKPTSIDRIQLMEDQWNGQVIRSYGVYAKIAGDDNDAHWTLLSNGTSVGHKKIDIFDGAVNVTAVKVNSTYVDTPKWRSISVHLCDRY